MYLATTFKVIGWWGAVAKILDCGEEPLAADYMAFISCIKEQDIPQGLLPLASEINKKEAIGTLKAFGFIKDRISGTSYDMYWLVYIAMKNWLRLKEQ